MDGRLYTHSNHTYLPNKAPYICALTAIFAIKRVRVRCLLDNPSRSQCFFHILIAYVFLTHFKLSPQNLHSTNFHPRSFHLS